MEWWVNLDITIFIGFLALNLIVGLRYSKGIKTIQDYALGGRNFSTGALVAAIVATWVSGSGFFITINKTYTDGLYYLLASVMDSVSLVILALLFIPKMGRFLGSTSVAESMGELYGMHVRLIVAVSGTINAMGMIAIQFKASGNIFSYFLGMPSVYAVIASGVVVTIYSSFGGMRGITFTDILQFFTFGFVLPLVGILIWRQVYYPGFEFAEILQDPKFDIRQVINFGNPKFWEMIPLFLYFAIPRIGPATYQRIAMGKNISQVKKAFLISAALVFVVELAVAWLPFLIYNVNPNIKTGELLSYIIDNYTFSGLKGLVVIGVVSMAMSTADSSINASAVLFANDIYGTLNIKAKNQLLVSKIFSYAIGILSIVLALSESDFLKIILTVRAFYMPIVSVPLMLMILGFRSSTKSVLIGMGTAFVTVVTWKAIGIEADCIAFAMLINLTFFVGSHYALKQPGGWEKVKHQEPGLVFDTKRSIDKNSILPLKIANKIAKFKLLDFFRKYSPKSELTYMSFGIYCIFYTITTMYSTQDVVFGSDSKITLYIYQIMLCTSITMAMYPIWPPRIKHEIIVQVAWNFVLFYMLVFFSGFFVLISKFYPLQFVVFSINMVIVASLTSWKRAVLMILPGFYLSTLFYKYCVGLSDGLDVSLGSPQYILMYSIVIIGAAFVIFLRPKEYAQELAEQRAEHLASTMNYKDREVEKALTLKNEFIRNVTHEYHAPMTGVISTLDSLIAAYDALDADKIKQVIKNVYQSAVRVESFDDNIRALARLSSNEVELKIEKVNLSELVNVRLEHCIKLYIEQNRRADYVFATNIEEDVIIEADEYYLTQTLDNLIINAFTYCTKGTIKLELKKKNAQLVEFSITDEGIGVPKEELHDIFGEFTVSSKTRTPAGGRGVGLALCKRVLEMHEGMIKAESGGGQTTFTFFLPLVFNSVTKPLSEEVIEIAQNFLKNGASVKLIAKSTGLKESQVRALQKQ